MLKFKSTLDDFNIGVYVLFNTDLENSIALKGEGYGSGFTLSHKTQ